MDDLEALFSSVDGFKEDLMDFGVAGAGAIAANLAWGYAEGKASENIEFVRANPIVGSVAAIVAGVAGGAAMAKYNKNLATGIAVGLVARGLNGLIKKFAVDKAGLPLLPPVFGDAGMGMTASERRLLFSGAPTRIEEVNGLHGYGAGLAATLS
jgi:ABC-type uncharacterized transport system permease subunit